MYCIIWQNEYYSVHFSYQSYFFCQHTVFFYHNKSSTVISAITLALFVQRVDETWALFSSEKWKLFGTVALLFVCNKYYPIMD